MSSSKQITTKSPNFPSKQKLAWNIPVALAQREAKSVTRSESKSTKKYALKQIIVFLSIQMHHKIAKIALCHNTFDPATHKTDLQKFHDSIWAHP